MYLKRTHSYNISHLEVCHPRCVVE